MGRAISSRLEVSASCCPTGPGCFTRVSCAPVAAPVRRKRRTAGEGCCAARAGRQRNTGPGAARAALCKRSSCARRQLPVPSQASRAAQVPERRICSQAQIGSRSRVVRTTSNWSQGMPSCCSPCAWGWWGGSTRNSCPPWCTSRVRAGASSASSPWPGTPSSSVSAPRGQPCQCSRASRCGLPVAMPDARDGALTARRRCGCCAKRVGRVARGWCMGDGPGATTDTVNMYSNIAASFSACHPGAGFSRPGRSSRSPAGACV